MFKSNVLTDHAASKPRKYSLPESQKTVADLSTGGFDNFERQIRERIGQNLVRNEKPDANSDLMKYQLKNLSFFKSLNTGKPPVASKHSKLGSQNIPSSGLKDRPVSGGSMGILAKNEGSADFNLTLKDKEQPPKLKLAYQKPSRTGSFDLNISSQGSKDKSVLLAAPTFEYSVHEMRHNRAKSDLNRGLLSGKGSHISPILEMAAKAGLKFSHNLDGPAPGKGRESKPAESQHPFDSLVLSINEKKRTLQDTSMNVPRSPGSDGGPLTSSYFSSKRPPTQPKSGGGVAGLLGDVPIKLEFGAHLAHNAPGTQMKWSSFAKNSLSMPNTSVWSKPPRPTSPASLQSRIDLPNTKNIQEQMLDWKSYPADGAALLERKTLVGLSNHKATGSGLSALESKVAGLVSKNYSTTPTRLENYSQAVRLVTQIGRPGSTGLTSGPKKTSGSLEMNVFFKKKSIVEEVSQQVHQRSKITLFGDTSFGRLATKSPEEKSRKGAQRDSKFLESKHKLLELNSSFKVSDSLGGLEVGTVDRQDGKQPSFSKTTDLSFGSFWREAKSDSTSLLGRHSVGFFKGRKPVGHTASPGLLMRPTVLSKSALWLD